MSENSDGKSNNDAPVASWLPRAEEWDFRRVPEQECRFACLWEYLRSVPAIASDSNGWAWAMRAGAGTISKITLLPGADLSLPWLTANKVSYVRFTQSDIKDLGSFVAELTNPSRPICTYLWHRFSAETRTLLMGSESGENISPTQVANSEPKLAVLIEELNRVLEGDCIYDQKRFAGVPLSAEILSLVKQKVGGEDLIRLNRMLLEDSFLQTISRNAQLRRLGWVRFEAQRGRHIYIRSAAEAKRKILGEYDMDHEPVDFLDRYLRDSDYILTPNFARAGVERIISELKSWVRREAKKWPRAPRANAANPAYNWLKLLATNRLDEARNRANIKFEGAIADLNYYAQKNSCTGPGLIPDYTSFGAWSKAKGQAKRLLKQLECNPKEFERKLFA
ncbi:MAG: hypothetical protein C5B50_00935 [Verrucomicrobia bacterium]|nr:MAG: hypothetical protein C5B50_00935 [Verrucomicrobiota bacterium]